MPRTRPAAGVRASVATSWHSVTWSLAIAVSYFLISSPLALEPEFDASLERAFLVTAVACLMTVPWLRMPRVPWATLPFLTFGLASCGWSIDRHDTMHFFGLYVLLTVLAVVAGANAGTRALARGVVGGAVVVLAASLYAYWQELPGARVPDGTSGYLAGVGTNRNILAYTMILALPFAVAYVPRTAWRRCVWALAVLVVLSGVVLAESATGVAAVAAVGATAVALAALDVFRSKGRSPGPRVWTAFAGLLVTAGLLAVLWYETLHRDLQRDLSLTGRVQVWTSVWEHSRTGTRMIGEGWGSVWAHPWRPASPNGEFDSIVRNVGTYVAHGHNSVMDLIPEVGLVGVALFSLFYLVPVARAVRWRRRSEHVEASRLVILSVIALVMAGITEPMSVVPLGFYVAVLIVAHVPEGTPVRDRNGRRAEAEPPGS